MSKATKYDEDETPEVAPKAEAPKARGPAPLAHRFVEYDADGHPIGQSGILTPEGGGAAARATHHYDLVSSVAVANALTPATSSSDATVDGAIIDRSGYGNVMFGFMVGVRTTGGTHTPKIMHGNAANLSDAAEVPDAQLVSMTHGTAPEAAAVLNTSNSVSRIGYKGDKRYVRFSIVTTDTGGGNTTLVRAFAVLASPGNV